MKYGYKLLMCLASEAPVFAGKSAVLSQMKLDGYSPLAIMAFRATLRTVATVSIARVLRHLLGKAWMRV